MFLVASVLLGQLQSSRRPGQAVVQESVAAVTAPIVGVFSAAGRGIRNAAAALPRAGELARENRQLKVEIEEMKKRNAALEDAALERRRLEALLRLRSQTPRLCVAARVIGRRLTQWPESMIIDKGRSDGIRPRQAVIAPAGLVGRIYSVSAHTALAVPVTDRNSSVGALVQRSRDAGILTGDGAACELEYLPAAADVTPGDIVVTSGLGDVFAKGTVIGVVVSVTRDDAASMKRAQVRPSVNLSRLEEVVVTIR
jgi:rod shape-determining protein MreC